MKRLIDEGHRFTASAAARNRNNVRRFSSLPAPNGGSQKQQPSQQYSQQYVYPQKAQPQYVQQQPIVQYPQKTVPTGKPVRNKKRNRFNEPRSYRFFFFNNSLDVLCCLTLRDWKH